MNHERGFLSSLFDLSFTDLITLRLIKVVYVLVIIAAAAASLGYVVVAFKASTAGGFLALLFSWIPFLIYVILARVSLEMVIIFFRISEDVKVLVGRKKIED